MAGQPNNYHGNQNCVMMCETRDRLQPDMQDVECNRNISFVCQRRSGEDEGVTNLADLNYIMIGVPVGVVLLLIGGTATIFLVRKFKCCHRTSASNNEQEMAPLRSTGRPLPLAQFRERNNPCRPTEDEFEKMESDARNRNISKSNSAAMEFVNSNIPINRY